MAAHMDKLSEAVWFNGRGDHIRKRTNLAQYRKNYVEIFGDKPLNIMNRPEPTAGRDMLSHSSKES